MKVGASELLLSAAGIAGAVFLYQWSVRLAAKKNYNLPWDPNDGLDPNYAGGKKIYPKHPVDSHDMFVPTCQIWNDESQIYENAGNPKWDGSADECFANIPNEKAPRYVDSKGVVTFKTAEGGLDAPITERGLCYFWDPKGGLFSLPDHGTIINPPNRDQRLCFSAGEKIGQTGRFFVRTRDNQTFTNPEVPWEVDSPLNPTFVPGDSDTYVPKDYKLSQCQLYKQLVSPTKGTMQAWLHTQYSSGFDNNQQGCLFNGGGRYWDVPNKRIVYVNPNTNALEEEVMIDFT